MSSIGFTEDLVSDVLNGKKKLTYRLGSKFANKLSRGQIVSAVNSGTDQVFAQLKVVSTQITQIKKIDLNQNGHEKYEAYDNLIASMQKHYPQDQVSLDSIVSMVEFELF